MVAKPGAAAGAMEGAATSAVAEGGGGIFLEAPRELSILVCALSAVHLYDIYTETTSIPEFA